jgi:hypothetical protein
MLAISKRYGGSICDFEPLLGQNHPLTLTTGNYATFLKSIPYEALPKTFQDALLVTRNLGVRYIWIDSPCILQVSIFLEQILL